MLLNLLRNLTENMRYCLMRLKRHADLCQMLMDSFDKFDGVHVVILVSWGLSQGVHIKLARTLDGVQQLRQLFVCGNIAGQFVGLHIPDRERRAGREGQRYLPPGVGAEFFAAVSKAGRPLLNAGQCWRSGSRVGEIPATDAAAFLARIMVFVLGHDYHAGM